MERNDELNEPRARGSVPIEIGSRLELMVDEFLIARLNGGAGLRLNRPVPREVALRDRPTLGGKYLHIVRDLSGRRPLPHVLSRPPFRYYGGGP